LPKTITVEAAGAVTYSAPFQNRIDFAVALGSITQQFSETESSMSIMFSVLLNTDPKIGSFILDQVIDNRRKRNIVCEIARHRIQDPDLLLRVRNVAKSYQDTADKRNLYIHAKWGLSENYPDNVVKHMGTWAPNTVELYDTDDFTGLIREIVECRDAIVGVIRVLAKHYGTKIIGTEELQALAEPTAGEGSDNIP
jgi:hypothetical protein